jgi:DNA-binding NarL/FixJ family response regulator
MSAVGGPDPITVAVIDDHPIYREGLARAVEGSDRFTMLGAYESVDQYLAAAPMATVVLLDYQLPGRSGPGAVRTLTEQGAAVLMVSADIGREAVLDTLGAGARGYVAKHAEAPEILEAIGIVSHPDHPGTYVSATLASYLLEASRTSGPDTLDLTEREREVLGLVAAGERDRDIAEALFISIGTVRSHLDHIRDKTGRRRRVELAQVAMDLGVASRDRPT